ncbi:MAG: hypothetical protein VX641_05940 [Planctomycetota bacterium]|nr:hypothetical protein [Planctomycetota bacterium]
MSGRHPARDHDRDRLARVAARLLAADPGLGVDGAILRARRTAGLPQVQAPSRSLVHRHLEAVQQMSLGREGFEHQQARELREVVDLLDLVQVLLRPDGIQVVGRVATHHVLGGVDVHARVHGGDPLHAQADAFEAAGLQSLRFHTVKTLRGHLPRDTLECEGRRYILTGCPSDWELDPARNLFTGEVIASCWLEQLRDRATGSSSGSDSISQDRP